MREYEIPWWGSLPLWVFLLLMGREVFMTGLRAWAKRRGVVIAAGGAGKLKTIIQDVFIGATILWFAWRDLATAHGWRRGWAGGLWDHVHGWVVALTLGFAVLLTLYSLAIYLYRYRSLFRSVAPPPGDGP
jgi:phosphatidylglycerophosphate synthase